MPVKKRKEQRIKSISMAKRSSGVRKIQIHWKKKDSAQGGRGSKNPNRH
jgi:hypothetical protein